MWVERRETGRSEVKQTQGDGAGEERGREWCVCVCVEPTQVELPDTIRLDPNDALLK